MTSITKGYLTGIIFKEINVTIDQYRESKKQPFDNESYPVATDEEVLDFIISIPYFDDKLKDFLIGNLVENTIIISQTWEIEFIKRTRLWSESDDWLHGNDYLLGENHINPINKDRAFLTLPY